MTSVLATVLAAALYAAAFPPFGASWLCWVALVPLCLALRTASAASAAAGRPLGGLATLAVVAWLLPTLTGHYQRSIFFAAALSAGRRHRRRALPRHRLRGLRARALGRSGGAPAGALRGRVGRGGAADHLGLRSPWARLGDLLADGRGSASSPTSAACMRSAGSSRSATPRSPSWSRCGRAGPRIRARSARRSLRADLRRHGSGNAVLRRAPDAPVRGLGRRAPLAVVQANEAPALRWRQAAALRVLADHARLTEAELAREPLPDLVVWPESALQIGPRDPRYALSIDALSRRVPLLLGAPRSEERAGARLTHNSAWLLGAGGTALTYDKRRLLPFAETRPLGLALGGEARRDLDPGEFAAGAAPGLFPLARDVLGTMICLEALYPADARELARRGATLLVNLSNDGWYRGRGGAEQHFAGVVLRAVETRLPFVRSTSTGVSAIVDAGGAVVAALPTGRAGVLAGSVPPGAPGASLYVRIGDVFALACAALWAAALLFALASGHRASRSG